MPVIVTCKYCGKTLKQYDTFRMDGKMREVSRNIENLINELSKECTCQKPKGTMELKEPTSAEFGKRTLMD